MARRRATASAGPLKLIALPRSPNPYQTLLYQELCRDGARLRYAGERTPSHTLNVLLLPLELAGLRAAGWNVLHLHWTFAFRLTGSDRFPFLRRLAQAWFAVVLLASRALGLRVIWTAHNALPHEPSFADEPAARRLLVRRSDLVLVHSAAALAELERVGAHPRRVAVVVHGSPRPEVDPAALRPPGADGPPLRLLFFGQVLEYKGVEDLLSALSALPPEVDVQLTIAGACRDVALGERLRAGAARSPHPVHLRLEYLPDRELFELLAASDVVTLPFRRITTSGSLLLAMAHGRVVVIPARETLAAIPDDAVIRYDGSVAGLAATIENLAGIGGERLAKAGAAAGRWAAAQRWTDAAAQMRTAIQGIA